MKRLDYFSLASGDDKFMFFSDETGEVRLSVNLLDQIMELGGYARDTGSRPSLSHFRDTPGQPPGIGF